MNRQIKIEGLTALNTKVDLNTYLGPGSGSYTLEPGHSSHGLGQRSAGRPPCSHETAHRQGGLQAQGGRDQGGRDQA